MENDKPLDSPENKDKRFLEGPPFDPRDYMISPSTTESIEEEKSCISTPPCGSYCRDLNLKRLILDPHEALYNLQKLIRDRFAVKFIDRQGDLLAAFIKATPPGFLMEDIPVIIEVVEFFIYNIHQVIEYRKFLELILSTVNCPPRISKSSDVLHCQKELSDYFTMYGELLATFDDQPMQFLVLKIIQHLISRRSPADIDCIKLQYCLAALEESQLPYVIASLLETIPANFYPHYLEVALQMIAISTKSCATLIKTNVIEFVLWRLDPYYSRRDKNIPPVELPHVEEYGDYQHAFYMVLESTAQLVWELLYAIAEFDITASSPSHHALWSLRIAFHIETRKKTQRALEARNSLGGLIIKLYSVFGENLPIIQSGLATDIAMLAVATEIGTEKTWAQHVMFTTKPEDFLLKNLMIVGCCHLAKEPYAVNIIRQQKVVEGILHLINPNLTHLTVPWTSAQFTHLLFTALRLLSEVAPILPDIYVDYKGTTRLLLLLEWCLEEHFDRKPLLEALKTFSTIVTCKNNSKIIQDVKEQYGMKTVLNVCQHILVNVSPLKREHHEILARAFMILERLLKDEIQFNISFGEQCVNIANKFLQRILSASASDSQIDSRLLLCFGAFLWEAVVWNPSQVHRFMERGGVFLILDLIEMSCYPVQVLFLGILVDISDEGNAIDHLLTWRGKNGYGLMTLLIKIWRHEERIFKVHRSENGCIIDLEKPLMTEEQWFYTGHARNAQMCSPSVVDMIGSSRPKIHAIYQLLKQRYLDKTDIGETSYCLYLKTIKPSYQVYLPLVEHYLALKIGEVWYEVLKDIDSSGIFPSSFDGYMIGSLVDHKNKWACRIKTVQEEILLFQKLDETKREKSLYEFLRSCRLAPALDALHELDYVARTTFKQFQKEKKMRQRMEIGNLEGYCDEMGNVVHRTFSPNFDVTCLPGTYVWIKSEKVAALETDVLRIVSEPASDEDLLNDESK